MRARRIALSVSSEKLARALGVSIQQVIAWELGVTESGRLGWVRSQKFSMSVRGISSRVLIPRDCTELHQADSGAGVAKSRVAVLPARERRLFRGDQVPLAGS